MQDNSKQTFTWLVVKSNHSVGDEVQCVFEKKSQTTGVSKNAYKILRPRPD